MARDYMTLGPNPAEEPLVSETLGGACTPDDETRELIRYRDMLKRRFPGKPEACHFVIKSFPHDLGSYREVCVTFDTRDEVQVAFAYHCERNLPGEWSDNETIPFKYEPPVDTGEPYNPADFERR